MPRCFWLIHRLHVRARLDQFELDLKRRQIRREQTLRQAHLTYRLWLELEGLADVA